MKLRASSSVVGSGGHPWRFLSPPRPGGLWDPPSLISSGTCVSFPRIKVAGAWS